MTPGKVRKLAKDHRRHGHGQEFGAFVAAHLAADRRVISYSDPVGELAVYKVMGGGR